MAKDTWYKRLGWFILFSAITLVIFFVIDLVVQRVVEKYESSNVTAYFVDSSGQKVEEPLEILQGDDDLQTVRLKIFGSVGKFKITVSVDGTPLLEEFNNTGDIEFQLPSIPGEYVITCNFHAYPTFGKEQDILLTRKVIIKEKKLFP